MTSGYREDPQNVLLLSYHVLPLGWAVVHRQALEFIPHSHQQTVSELLGQICVPILPQLMTGYLPATPSWGLQVVVSRRGMD
jgi:hypothetical protein